MMLFRKIIVYTLFCLLIASLFFGIANAITFNINIEPNGQVDHKLDLLLEDRILLQIRNIGSTTGNFSVNLYFPDGSIENIGNGNSIDYNFICELEGEYFLILENWDLESDILVTLNVEIQNYIFGIPKMLFLTLVIVGICLVGVVFFVFLGKTY
jgi:hypothetical protein